MQALMPLRLYVVRGCVLDVLVSHNLLQSTVPVDWISMCLRSNKLMKGTVTEQCCGIASV